MSEERTLAFALLAVARALANESEHDRELFEVQIPAAVALALAPDPREYLRLAPEPFRLDDFSDTRFPQLFRFPKTDIPLLCSALQLPPGIISSDGSRFNAEHAICVVLRRLSSRSVRLASSVCVCTFNSFINP
jgi:hypothetical protein